MLLQVLQHRRVKPRLAAFPAEALAAEARQFAVLDIDGPDRQIMAFVKRDFTRGSRIVLKEQPLLNKQGLETLKLMPEEFGQRAAGSLVPRAGADSRLPMGRRHRPAYCDTGVPGREHRNFRA